MKAIKRLDTELSHRAAQSIAHSALTNSKRPESFVLGVYPQHLKKGKGCYVWDTYDNKYIDFICGLGSNLLGYANNHLEQAIVTQLQKGTNLSLGTEIEVNAAERIKEFFPFVNQLRFLKTGSEACSAAIRIARAYTGRNLVLSDGYHGFHDAFTSLTPPASGVPQDINIMRLPQSLYMLVDRTAAIIVEPVITDSSTGRIEYLRELRKTCDQTGVVLIFDEIITALRYSQYSVSVEHDVKPDLICLGKAIGGGLPLSVVGGRKEIMEADYFVSSTFAGDTLALAGCIKTLDLLQNKYKINQLWERGAQFLFKFNEIWREGLTLEGYPTRSRLVGDPLTKALFMQECCKAGILMGPSLFFIFDHIEVMDECLSTFTDILKRIKLGEVTLQGEMPKTPYAQKVREKNG